MLAVFKFLATGLEEVRDFLEESFPSVTIAIAHGKVCYFKLIDIFAIDIVGISFI